MDKKEVLKAFEFRHACKEFESEKRIPNEDLRFILETGRLSPSSFGLEQWKFIVIQSRDLKEKLQPACFNQKQITTSSEVVAVLARKGLYEAGSQHVAEMFRRWGYPDDIYNYLIDFHSQLAKNYDLTHWAVEQCHIAAANMMTAAAMIGIDSCPIGGFLPDKVKEVLDINGKKHEVALLIAFGYRTNPQPPKVRLPFEEVVEYR